MNKSAFTFDYVCVTPDCQIGWHAHPLWELSLVIYGAGSRIIGNLTEPIVEGEIILIPPNIPHVWQFDQSYTNTEGNIANISIFFETTTLDNLSVVIPEFACSIYKIKSLTEAVNIKGEAHDEVYKLLMAMRELPDAARTPRMLELLRLIADARNCVSVGSNNTLSRSEQRLEKVRAFCHCNYGREISLDEIAAHVGMNKSAFCTFMRRHAGMSMSEFVNDIRLRRATEMLRHTDKSIAEIAYDTGFANVTYFNRLFRNKYNCTPKSVRLLS